MLTGDAPLTALKVAQGIGLCTKTNAPPLTLRRKPGTGGSGQPPAAFEWVGILARHQTSDDDDDDDKDKDGAGDDKASGGDGRGSEAVAPIPLAVPGVRALAQKHDLCVLESILDEASAAFHASTAGLAHKAAIAAKAPASEDASKDSASGSGSSSGSSGSGLAEVESGPCAEGDVFSEVDAIRVFARCSPHGKAKVIRALQRNDPENHVLMCGDGGNDVGALKQADVGLALLSGYGNANTTDLDSSSSASSADGQPQQLLQGGGSDNSLTLVGKSGDSNHKSAEKALNDQAAELAKRGAQAAKLRKTLLAEKQKELSANMPQRLQEEVAAMKVTCYSRLFLNFYYFLKSYSPHEGALFLIGLRNWSYFSRLMSQDCLLHPFTTLFPLFPFSPVWCTGPRRRRWGDGANGGGQERDHADQAGNGPRGPTAQSGAR